MADRDQRVEKIRAAARAHPVVRFAVQSLLPKEAAFLARPSLTAELEERLRALGPTDALVAAALGLIDLAYVLRRQSSPEAADAVLEALSKVASVIGDALSTLPPDDETLAAIRAARFAVFSGSATCVVEERRPPAANQIASGPLARAAMSQVIPKHKKP